VARKARSWVLQEHILRDSGIGNMDSDFGNALDGLLGMIPYIDFISFTNNDIVHHKAHVLVNILFSKSVKIYESEV
jgi:hypothetical protein